MADKKGNSRSLGSSMSLKNQQKRSLESSWKCLDLERDHYLKLMAMNERVLRSRHDKLEGRMSSLMSHLTAPEIDEIERAERRHRKAKSSTTSTLVVDDVDLNTNHRSIELVMSTQGRSNSFYGHSCKASRKTDTAEREEQRSISFQKPFVSKMKFSHSAPKTRLKFSDEVDGNVNLNNTHPPTRASLASSQKNKTLKWNKHETDHKTKPRMTSTSPRLSASVFTSSPSRFSCHEERKQRHTEQRRSKSVDSSSRARTPSTPSSTSSSVFYDAVDEVVHKDRTRNELRNLMVIENDLQYLHLERRKEALLSGIDGMIKRDREAAERRLVLPPAEATMSLTTLSQAQLMESAYHGADIKDVRMEIRRRKTERMRERMKMEMPTDQLKRKEGETEDEYTKRLEKWWRDMRKVRYLRRASTKQDLGDVVTLAMAQQRNDTLWRQSLRDNLF